MSEPTSYEAFCIGAEICFTECGETCPADGSCADLCHELVKPEAEQAHRPADCPTTLREHR